MKIGKVIGSVWATRKAGCPSAVPKRATWNASLHGSRLEKVWNLPLYETGINAY